MRTLFRASAVALLTLCALTTSARAHEYWLAPSSWRAEPGATVALGALAGQGFSGERKLYSPDQVVRWVARAARDLDLTRVASPGDSTWARFAPADRGGLLIAYESDFSDITLDGATFDRYLEDQGLDAPRATRHARGDIGPGRERYRRCAKAWLAGDARRRATSPLGLPFEIVPLDAPGAGATLPVRLLFDGRPLSGALLHAWRQPFDPRGRPLDPARRTAVAPVWTGRTDARGEARVPVAAAGEWLLSAVHMIPARDHSAADWESSWASLSFGRAPAPH
jgi:uncharacterized GH25 family protein